MTIVGNTTLGEEAATILRSWQTNPDDWFGPSYISVVTDQLFVGILCGQLWTYYSSFPKDPMWMKLLVGLTSLLFTFNTTQSVRIVWEKAIVGFADWELAIRTGWDVCIQPMVTTIILCSAQIFFIWRCYAATGRNRYFLAVLVLTLLAERAASVGLSMQLRTNLHDVDAVEKWALPRVIITSALDVIISVTVSYTLLASRRGDSRNTDVILKKLVIIIWQSALPPTFVQLTGLAIHFSDLAQVPNRSFLLNELTASLYVFSLMYTLNSRLEIRKFSQRMYTHDRAEQLADITAEVSEVRFRRDQADLSIFSTFDHRDQKAATHRDLTRPPHYLLPATFEMVPDSCNAPSAPTGTQVSSLLRANPGTADSPHILH